MLSSRMLLAGTAGIALGLFLGGCNSADSNPVKPAASGPVGTTDLKGSSDFDRDLIAAKQGSGNSANREEAIEAVLSRYGVPHSTARAAQGQQPGPVTEAVAKTAATTFVTAVRNFSADNDIHTFYTTVIVPAFGSLVVSATASQDGVDPFLVAFSRNDASSNTDAYAISVAGYNDDVSSTNRNSQLVWVNTGFTNKKIEIVAFNYLPSTRGTVGIGISVNGAVAVYSSRFLGGKVEYGTDAFPSIPSNCAPSFTAVTESNRAGGGFSAAALVVDTKAMKGGIIWDRPDLGSQSLGFSPQLNNPYPSFALLFEATSARAGSLVEEGSAYGYLQRDYYICFP
ncbi:MAG: hypothetical protein JF616_22325 [Fibrobacteres bacterium]|jgi:hypothetical protein|nr:hypothetical protein [Fibrobacterota bacterium]